MFTPLDDGDRRSVKATAEILRDYPVRRPGAGREFREDAERSPPTTPWLAAAMDFQSPSRLIHLTDNRARLFERRRLAGE